MRTFSKAGIIALFLVIFAGSLPLSAQYYEDEWIPKIRFEFGGAWMGTVFGDMLLITEADEDLHKFYYDDRYTDMFTRDLIKYWSSTGLDTGFPTLKGTFPLDIRARIQSPWYFVTFSVGFRMFSSDAKESLPVEYIRAVDSNEGYADIVTYDSYHMRANGYALPLTGYFNMTEGRGVDASLYLGIGPFYAKALYEKAWTEGFQSIINGISETIAPSVSHSLRMEGSGWGIMFEAGTRLDFNISRRFALFVEAGYLYQTVFSLKGEGREMNGSTVETWNGQWMIRTRTLTAEWDTDGTDIELIESRPDGGAGVKSEEPFSLNITGATVRLGFSLRF